MSTHKIDNKPCECVNWCRDGRDMVSPHHPNGEHYEKPFSKHDLWSYATFGALMWKLIERMGGEFCADEWSEEVLPLAQKAGLCKRVIYDPEKHGDGIDAEPGSEIWYWGKEL